MGEGERQREVGRKIYQYSTIFNKEESYVEGNQRLEKTQERRRERGEDLAREISNINKSSGYLILSSRKPLPK